MHLANNFGNVHEQTMAVTGAAYNLASSNAIAAIDFGVLHVGDPTATRALTIANTAPAGAFSEGLDSSLGSYVNNGGSLTPGFVGSIANAGGYDEVIGTVTLALEGDVASSPPRGVPEPPASGLGLLVLVLRRERRPG